ncbi:MAG TPA: PKD domain-containing protein [Mycobacteriales bacterium]|jgi:M6 family metalloprotease-like protein|nr:PKD domain-containing protein [Mycobacteriales bacterium]
MLRVRSAVAAVVALPVVFALGYATPGATAKAPLPKVPDPAIRAAAHVALPHGRKAVHPGEPAAVAGTLRDRAGHPVAATYSLRVSDPAGRVLGTVGPLRSGADGSFRATVPGSLTKGVRADRDSHYVSTLAVRVVDVTAGRKHADDAGAAPLAVAAAPAGLELDNDFTSSVGWVKPGDTYPFRVVVRNYTTSPVADATVTLPAVPGMRFTKQQSATGTVTVADRTITWTIPSVPGAADETTPAAVTLVVEGAADTTQLNPRIVWEDLSTTATLTYGATTVTSKSHGPKVIPPGEQYDTARYGDRPFPVVPVDYVERKHSTEHNGQALADKINSPSIEGSTFNLYQEMSYGQLYPHATVPSAGIATAPFDSTNKIDFTDPRPNGVCTPDGLTTLEAAQGTAAYAERIHDGWYQLPGTTQYYGLDRYGPQAAFVGAVASQSLLFDIDSACGPTAKGVFDAAAIADPEIDYSDFDTDKDGVVDFFMMVFAGVGGHGASVTEKPPYDNIWPHSSSLEFTYTDPVTKQGGYVSKDQLKDLEGRPLWYTDGTRTTMTTTPQADDKLKVFVRVGPYNVNPESAIDKASVISHEYGHSLGLPDFYSTNDRDTYGDWNLMATDKSQNMDVFSKQDLGWIVPRVLPQGSHTATGWRDSKINTHQIEWRTPAGSKYVLEGANVANGEAYTVKLPGRTLISPEKVSQGASPSHVWWSGSGNDFGCAPEGGHNLDISLPELKEVAAGTTVTVSFASYWDMEWDYDYGFVLISPDSGETYTSVPSDKGYTTPAAQNPNTNNCQTRYGNGITGTSGSYQANTQQVDRVNGTASGTQYPDGPFLQDSYDISDLAGTDDPVLRFSYATDPGVAHPGWFIDDLVIKVGDKVIYQSNFESFEKDRPHIYNGGCKEDLRVAANCTKGWQYISSDVAATADHGYYMEMRDRSGFDFNGKNENDREGIAFQPGMLLVYTNESHGYGNAGTDDPPAQSPLDANPQPGESHPNLNDAAFAQGDTYNDSDHVDNYLDPSTESGNWEFRFSCLSFKVDKLAGDDVGPDSDPGTGGNLVGNVTFQTRPRCAAFDYGYNGAVRANVAPTAVLQVKPESAKVGQVVTFDGSSSFDDRDAPPDLTYAWSFGDGATGSGRTARHTYAKAGTYTVTLKVTDRNGASTTATRSVTVGATAPPKQTRQQRQMPATGLTDTYALLALMALGGAAALRRRTRRAA